jgi:MFS family permease
MPFQSYVRFAAANRRFVAFGFLAAFGSSFGQTYFIGIVGPGIQGEFGLSHTAWGTIYMIGTLASALLLPWTGKQIDRLDLRLYTALACLLLVVASVVTAATLGPIMLVLAIFLLRQSGQGLMSHIALTSMARYFDVGRGRAIAIASLGFSAGEAMLPFLAVLAIGLVGWRWTYGGVALLVLAVILPLLLWLLKGHGERHRSHISRLADPANAMHGVVSWTRGQVMRDPNFYLLLVGILAPSLILTAMFFHHLNLAAAKGWSNAWITGNYIVYAVATVATSLSSGPLIDRLGAVRLVPFMLAPLTLAMIVIGLFDNPFVVWPYFILAGLSTGVGHTAISAMWAEVYGVAHLGAIKSLVAALGVFSSALGPVAMGGLMDLGVAIGTVCLIFAGYTVVGAVTIMIGLKGYRRQRA